jgi:hypothetical protein
LDDNYDETHMQEWSIKKRMNVCANDYKNDNNNLRQYIKPLNRREMVIFFQKYMGNKK